MKFFKLSFLALVLLLLHTATYAQIGKGLLNRVKERAVQKVENILVEKASDAIARRFERKLDDALREAYENRDTSYYATSDSIDYSTYATFLKSLDQSTNVAETYDFDFQQQVIIRSGKEDPQTMTYLFAENKPYFGMAGETEEGVFTYIIDTDNELIVVYQETDGEKQAYALPSMLGLAAKYADKTIEENHASIEKTGKTKKVAGYTCEEYKYEENETNGLVYLSNDIDFDYPESMGELMKRFINEEKRKTFYKMDGFPLESISYDKKGKEESSMTTEKIGYESVKIVSADYTFSSYATTY